MEATKNDDIITASAYAAAMGTLATSTAATGTLATSTVETGAMAMSSVAPRSRRSGPSVGSVGQEVAWPPGLDDDVCICPLQVDRIACLGHDGDVSSEKSYSDQQQADDQQPGKVQQRGDGHGQPQDL